MEFISNLYKGLIDSVFDNKNEATEILNKVKTKTNLFINFHLCNLYIKNWNVIIVIMGMNCIDALI